METILTIDQGTTSSRAILFDKKGGIIDVEQKEFRQIFPKPGWVEHDAEEIWQSVVDVVRALLEKSDAKTRQSIKAFAITNQRETTILWDKNTGEPIHNAIVWQDRRTADFCDELKAQNAESDFRQKTGLLLDPYFSGTKVKWILDNVEGAREKAKNGDILFGTVDSFLLWRLTGGASHKTDMSNASRTLLFNIKDKKWDNDILSRFDIPAAILPQVCDNIGDFGTVKKDLFGLDVPVMAMAGDQQAATFGQACFQRGEVKSTYGTGCFVLLNTGHELKFSQNRLLSTVAWSIDGEVTYAIEGSIFVAGSAIQFLRDGLGLLAHAKDSEDMAVSLPSNDNVYFVPALTGLGAPYWDAQATGLITGLTRGTTKAHIVRAALEAQAYQTLDLLAAMKDDSGQDIQKIRVDGGLVANNWVCQFLADMTDVEIDRPRIIETTAMGVAFMAMLGCGMIKDMNHIRDIWALDRKFKPNMKHDERESLYKGWQSAVKKVQTH